MNSTTTPPPRRLCGTPPPLHIVPTPRPTAAAVLTAVPPAVQARAGFDLCGLVAGAGLEKALELTRKVCEVAAPAVITGETGTGKELFARIIHANGPRRNEVFVAINCSAIPEGLIESELFGHERGAFTGAHARKTGIFERASRGTVFLDEVAEMSPATQVKLLRVLNDGSFCRVGGTREMKTEARIIAATNKDLARELAAGRFRQDLFFRLSVLAVKLPSLRERREDIPELAGYFLARAAQQAGRGPLRLSFDAEHALMAHEWPGNVRELENSIMRAAVLSEGRTITAADLQPAVPDPKVLARGTLQLMGRLALADGWGLKRLSSEIEKAVLLAALEKAGGNKSRAAEMLGLKRTTFVTRLQRHGLSDEIPE